MFSWSRKIQNVSVVVPTMNSEKYIEPLVLWLNNNFTDVVIGVDSKTSDRTREIVSKYHVGLIDIPNDTGNRVEQMLEFISSKCKNNWVLRLDDDEFLSNATLNFLKNTLNTIKVESVAFHRK